MPRATHSSNPAVRIVAHNTSPKQSDVIHKQRVKLHATTTSVDDVGGLLEDAVDAGELEALDNDYYAVPE